LGIDASRYDEAYFDNKIYIGSADGDQLELSDGGINQDGANDLAFQINTVELAKFDGATGDFTIADGYDIKLAQSDGTGTKNTVTFGTSKIWENASGYLLLSASGGFVPITGTVYSTANYDLGTSSNWWDDFFSRKIHVHSTDSLTFVSPAGTTEFARFQAITGDFSLKKTLNLDSDELTIAAGVVTATKSKHTVDTQDDDPTDDLATINGGTAGDVLIITTADDGRDVTVKDGTGNIQAPADCVLDDTDDTFMATYDGTNWLQLSCNNNS